MSGLCSTEIDTSTFVARPDDWKSLSTFPLEDAAFDTGLEPGLLPVQSEIRESEHRGEYVVSFLRAELLEDLLPAPLVPIIGLRAGSP